MKTPKEVLREWEAAYNARDPHALIELYHDNAESVQVPMGAPLIGRKALLENFISFFHAFPDNYTNIESLFEDGEWAIIEWRGGGTFLGELGYMAPTGKKFTLRGSGFFHVVEGRIRVQRGYFDRHTWFNQIGVPL